MRGTWISKLSEVEKLDMRIVQIILLLLAIPLFALSSCRFIDGFKYWRQSKEIQQSYIDEIEELKAKQNELLDYVERLKNDESAMEVIARTQGYIKEGEIVYRIVSSMKNSPPKMKKELDKTKIIY